jgi:hypothetical protein
MERALKDFFRTLALTILIIAAASAPAAALVEVLKRCGDKLTRENIMNVVANLDFEINTYIPGSASRPLPRISIRSSRCK